MFTVSFFSLLLDTLIAVLLCITIAYCWILNQRIKILQDGKSELAQLLKHFDDSTKRASESIIALQTTSKRIGEGIQVRIEKSNYLIEDLAYMIDKGEKMANRMDASFAVSRARGRVMAEEAPRTAQRSEMKSTLNPAVKVLAKVVEKFSPEKPPEKTMESAPQKAFLEKSDEAADIRHRLRADASDSFPPPSFPPPETNGDSTFKERSNDNRMGDNRMGAQAVERPQIATVDEAVAMVRQKKLSAIESMLEKVNARAKMPTMEEDEDARFTRRPGQQSLSSQSISSPNWPKASPNASINPPAESSAYRNGQSQNVMAAAGTRPAARTRSKAEQELLDMLKAGIKG